MVLHPRHTIPGFIERTQKNLKVIQCQAATMGHPVAQLVCSMLGLVVFPYEDYKENDEATEQFAKSLKEKFERSLLKELEQNGWPHWDIRLDNPKQNHETTTTLHHLVWHLRNAVSHYRVDFDSDSRELSKVNITFEDKPPAKNEPINWSTTIRGAELLTFCNKLAESALQIANNVLG
jgi:HEPN pEK499 p136